MAYGTATNCAFSDVSAEVGTRGTEWSMADLLRHTRASSLGIW